MESLIKPEHVLQQAFSPEEGFPPEAITIQDIVSAEERYLIPIIGRKLYQKFASGNQPEFVREYLAAPLALYTRAMLQPRLNLKTGALGTTSPRTNLSTPAQRASCHDLQRSLLRQARALMTRATDYLATHAPEFPEYDPSSDPLNHCSLDGNMVQIF